MRIGRFPRGGLLVSVALLAGCPGPSASEDHAPASSADERPVETDPRQERAKLAAKALGGQLKARLGEAIKAGGLAAGIAACKVAAPEIAAATSKEQGLRLGRTSFKLRNPANAPPDWARADVDARKETPTFSEGPGGALRALLPIRMEALCVSCHGPKEALAEEVRGALAEAYPEDQATGFAAGDLRGWFWVEVPKS